MALKDNQLKYSKAEIDEAGKQLVNPSTSLKAKEEALQILNNFRSCHAYPINTFQATLRTKLRKKGYKDFLVSQRLKRTPSIVLKLERYKTMRLSQMQDLGGLRAILATMKDVNDLIQLYRDTTFPHRIHNEKDYIINPKNSGYRCYHIVYKYENNQNPNYDGLMIELQIRTRLQHSWATAVETMGTFIQHSLKSSQGPQDWLDFFSLVGNAFAYQEGTTTLKEYKTLSEIETYQLVRQKANTLQIIEKLQVFRSLISITEFDRKQGNLYLIILDIENKKVQVKTFSTKSIEQASDEYLREESTITDSNKKQVVLVSSNSIDSLKKAYPSYFLDTEEFIFALKKIITQSNLP